MISKLKLKNHLSSSLIKETVIEGKEIIYKSQIIFTPLLDEVTIDFGKIKDIVSSALELSGVQKEEIATVQ